MSDDFLLNYGELRNWGKIENAEKVAGGSSTQCGDKITIYLKLDRGIITDAKFEGEACILSTISSDMFMDIIKGKKIMDVIKMDDMAYLKSFPIQVSPGRIGCVLLPLRLIRNIKL